MNPLVRRIAIHGALTAFVLVVIGLMMAEMATIWISATVPTRPGAKTAPPDTSALRFRLPLLMASTGFALVAIGELLMHQLRKNRIPPVPKQSAPDQTETLLNELIAREETKAANSQRAVAPSTPSSQNTTTPISTPADHP
jgi:hypothetical protein